MIARIAGLCLFLLCFVSYSQAANPAKTANPNASRDAQRVLDYLAHLPDRQEKRVISGHFVNTTGRGMVGFDQIIGGAYRSTGKWVAMIGSDYSMPGAGADYELSKNPNPMLIDYWKQGGLVTVSWHAHNPWTGKDHNDTTRGKLSGANHPWHQGQCRLDRSPGSGGGRIGGTS